MGFREHGLTEDEDRLLGKFADPEEDYLMDYEIYSEGKSRPVTYSVAARKSLVERGLLIGLLASWRPNQKYMLTESGKKLWSIRAHEEGAI